jgi:hypothetical protein
MSSADMIRALEADHGIEVKRSSFYLYCKTLFAQERAANAQDLPEEVLVDSVMQGAQGEMIDRLAQLIEAVQQVRREGETRHAAVMDALQAFALHDALDRHSRQFQALFDLLRGTALWKIWLRALMYTGAGWSVGLTVYGYVWGWPF